MNTETRLPASGKAHPLPPLPPIPSFLFLPSFTYNSLGSFSLPHSVLLHLHSANPHRPPFCKSSPATSSITMSLFFRTFIFSSSFYLNISTLPLYFLSSLFVSGISNFPHLLIYSFTPYSYFDVARNSCSRVDVIYTEKNVDNILQSVSMLWWEPSAIRKVAINTPLFCLCTVRRVFEDFHLLYLLLLRHRHYHHHHHSPKHHHKQMDE